MTVLNTSSALFIDAILVKNEKNIAKSLVMPLSLRDHNLVNHQLFQHQTITCKNYSKYNPEWFKSIKNFDMLPLYKIDNVTLAWHFYKYVLIDIFNKHMSVISKCAKGTFCPWLTDSVKNQMNQREQLFRKFQKCKNKIDWKNYKNLRNKCTSLVRKAREQHHWSLTNWQWEKL